MVVAISLCTRCGSQTQADDRYCQDCGGFIEKSVRSEASASSIRKAFRPSILKLIMSSTRPGQPAFMMPILASAIGIVALIPICMYAIESSYRDISHKYLNEKALEAIAIGHTTEAIEIMTREKIEHATLRPDQLAIMDQALYRRSAQFMESKNYTAALGDLHRITTEFPRSLVDQRIAECTKLLSEKKTIAKPRQVQIQITRAGSK